jgi:hypothetical protein
VSRWFDIRTKARRDVHAAFSVPGLYEDPSTAEPVELAVRWHNQFGIPTGDVAGGNYAQILETVDRIVFDGPELVEKGLTLRRGGKITLVEYGLTFELDVREPNTSPGTVVWTVAN